MYRGGAMAMHWTCRRAAKSRVVAIRSSEKGSLPLLLGADGVRALIVNAVATAPEPFVPGNEVLLVSSK